MTGNHTWLSPLLRGWGPCPAHGLRTCCTWPAPHPQLGDAGNKELLSASSSPSYVAGRPGSAGPDSSAPRLQGRDRKALRAGSTLALLSPVPIPPATFLLPAPQGRGVPSPAHSCTAGSAQAPTSPCPHGCSELTGTVNSPVPKHSTRCFPHQWHNSVLLFPLAEK